MKKTFIVLLIILIAITIISVVFISNNNRQVTEIKKVNQEYEFYKDKIIMGTDVTTLINKAINSKSK